MRRLSSMLAVLPLTALAAQWPYKRVPAPQHMRRAPRGAHQQLHAQPEPEDLFISWLRRAVELDESGELTMPFLNNTIPSHVSSLHALWDHLEFPSTQPPDSGNKLNNDVLPTLSDYDQALELFRDIGYTVDPGCAADRTKWYYRTQDGSCNWMETGHSDWGQLGTARARDYDQHMYKDGISMPRDGPNPRAVSNAFFRRKKHLYYEHTRMILLRNPGSFGVPLILFKNPGCPTGVSGRNGLGCHPIYRASSDDIVDGRPGGNGACGNVSVRVRNAESIQESIYRPFGGRIAGKMDARKDRGVGAESDDTCQLSRDTRR